MKNLILVTLFSVFNFMGPQGHAQNIDTLSCAGSDCQLIENEGKKYLFAEYNLTFGSIPPHHLANLQVANLTMNPANCQLTGSVTTADYNHTTYTLQFSNDFWWETIQTDGLEEVIESTGQQSTRTSNCGPNYLPPGAYSLFDGLGGYYYSNGAGQYCALGATLPARMPYINGVESIPSVNKYAGLCAGYAGDYLPSGSYIVRQSMHRHLLL